MAKFKKGDIVISISRPMTGSVGKILENNSERPYIYWESGFKSWKHEDKLEIYNKNNKVHTDFILDRMERLKSVK